MGKKNLSIFKISNLILLAIFISLLHIPHLLKQKHSLKNTPTMQVMRIAEIPAEPSL